MKVNLEELQENLQYIEKSIIDQGYTVTNRQKRELKKIAYVFMCIGYFSLANHALNLI
jgi:hypothetical protein